MEGYPRVAAQEIVGAPSGASGPTYYDTVLGLFGLGFVEGRYQFFALGQLNMRRTEAANHRSASAPHTWTPPICQALNR